MVVGLIWIVCAVLVLSLPAPFHGAVKVVAGGAVLAALWYLLVLRRRIASGQAGVALYSANSAAAQAVTEVAESERHRPE
jgi:hypothetical protein